MSEDRYSNLRTQLRDELRPSPQTRERILLHVRARTAPRAQRFSSWSRRASFGALAAVGAVALALIVALSPFEHGSGSRALVPAPSSARAALREAATAAGAADWKPLAAGDYFHVMTTTFTPTGIPTRPGDPRERIDQLFTLQAPSSQESWIGPNGDGFALHVSGGNGDPKRFPIVSGSGKFRGYGMQPTFGRPYPEREHVSVADSLKLADLVRVDRTVGAHITDGLWYRTPRGFERKGGMSGTPSFGAGTIGGSAGGFNQLRYWNATTAQLNDVNDAARTELDGAVASLLDDADPSFNGTLPAQGMYGVTSAMEREEVRVLRAIDLLGSAPLKPEVRRAIFEWLAARPTAKLIGEATDVQGRRGTQVVLERISKRTVPGGTVTVDQLRRAWAKAHGVAIPQGKVKGPRAMVVKDDHQYRRWYVSIIFDRTSGELLQHIVYARQETTARRPHFERNAMLRDHIPWRLRLSVDRQGMSDAVLYGVRERTATIAHPLTAACATTPAMCATSS
jgi:hypothetical protein